MLLVSPEQVRAVLSGQRAAKPATRLPKRLQWTLPLMDEVMDEVRKNIDKGPKPRVDYSKLMNEVKKEMAAGKGDK